ncbi:universal stress protein [Archaeoglobales archaeon]|nr:MAG: universal stress protein [Archaeoglobales archaeon]
MRILVPVGDRHLGFKALEVAIEEAKLRGWNLIIVNSLYGGSKTKTEQIKRAEKLLDEAVKLARENDVDVEKILSVRGKEPGEDIVELADELRAHLIVMGCGIIREQFEMELMETTQYVILHASQPILLVK